MNFMPSIRTLLALVLFLLPILTSAAPYHTHATITPIGEKRIAIQLQRPHRTIVIDAVKSRINRIRKISAYGYTQEVSQRSRTYRGRSQSRAYESDNLAAVATVFRSRQMLRLRFSTGRKMYQVEIPVGMRAGSVRVLPIANYVTRECGNLTTSPAMTSDDSHNETASASVAAYSPAKPMEVEIFTDLQFAEAFEDETEDTAQDVINTAAEFYLDQIGIDFTVNLTMLDDVDFEATTIDELLEFFGDYVIENDLLGTSDAAHLISGSDDGTSVAGLAYVGVICEIPDASFGVSEYTTTSVSPIITAHEIGHNLNASHDPSNQGIMSASVSASKDSFSNFSINEIENYVDHYGACLSGTIDPGETGAGVDLLVAMPSNKKKNKLKLTLLKTTDDALTNCVIPIYASANKGAFDSIDKLPAEPIYTVLGSELDAGTIVLQTPAIKRANKIIYFAARRECDDDAIDILSTRKRIKKKEDVLMITAAKFISKARSTLAVVE